jgi:SAM-dependent methyltransferase
MVLRTAPGLAATLFLGMRATQTENFDAPHRSAAEIREGFELLGRLNRLVRFDWPFQRLIPHWLGEANCQQLTLLDVGAGDGSLARSLESWAAARGWQWEVTCLDSNPLAVALHASRQGVVGSALKLPFSDASFDIVIATHMTHHLEDEAAVVQHFREAWRVARRGVLIYDAHRNAFFYSALWFLLTVWRFPREMKADGLLSVRRGWRVSEWRRLAMEAGMVDASVWLDWGTRIILQATKRVS